MAGNPLLDSSISGNYSALFGDAVGEGIPASTAWDSSQGQHVAAAPVTPPQSLSPSQMEGGTGPGTPIWEAIKSGAAKVGTGFQDLLTGYGKRAMGWDPQVGAMLGIPEPSPAQSIMGALSHVATSVAAASGDPVAQQRIAQGPMAAVTARANLMKTMAETQQFLAMAKMRTNMSGLNLMTKDPVEQARNVSALVGMNPSAAVKLAGQYGKVPGTKDDLQKFQEADAKFNDPNATDAERATADQARKFYAAKALKETTLPPEAQPHTTLVPDPTGGWKSVVNPAPVQRPGFNLLGGAAAPSAAQPVPGPAAPAAAAPPPGPVTNHAGYRVMPQPPENAPTSQRIGSATVTTMPGINRAAATDIGKADVPLTDMFNELADLKQKFKKQYAQLPNQALMTGENLASHYLGVDLPEKTSKALEDYNKYSQGEQELLAKSLKPLYGRINEREIGLTQQFTPNPSMSPEEKKAAYENLETNLALTLIGHRAMLDRGQDPNTADIPSPTDAKRYFDMKAAQLGTKGANKYFGLPEHWAE